MSFELPRKLTGSQGFGGLLTRAFSRASLDPRCWLTGSHGRGLVSRLMVRQTVARAGSPSLLSLPLPGLLRLLCLVRDHLPRLDLCGGRGGQSPGSAAVEPGCRPTGFGGLEAHPPTGPARPPPPLPYFSPDNRSANLSPVTETPPPPCQASLLCCLASLPSKAPFLSSALDCSRPRRDLKLPSFQLATHSCLPFKLYGIGLFNHNHPVLVPLFPPSQSLNCAAKEKDKWSDIKLRCAPYPAA